MNIEQLYYEMYLIRKTEEKLLELFGKGELFGTVHTCIGQEAIPVGILNNVDIRKDLVFSNHRCHGHYIVLFKEIRELISELMGRKMGICSGMGGSQHLQKGNFFTNGIQGGMLPIAAGAGFVEKLNETDSVVIAFIGDGTLSQGIVYETINMVSLWKIPIMIVVENNQYAQSTPIRLNLAGHIADRFKAFNITTKEISTNDVTEINRISRELIEEIRKNRNPIALIVNTYRLAPHSKGDDPREPSEIEEHRKNDPLLIAESKIEDNIKERIKTECIERINKDLEFLRENHETLSKDEFTEKIKDEILW